MNISYDTAKDESNIHKHGVSLTEAANINWDSAIAREDTRENYGETRMICSGRIGDRLYVVVYTDRDGCRHIINLRKANRREISKYEQA